MISMFLGLPRWLKLAGIGALVVIAALIWLKLHDRAVIDDHEADREASASPARETAAAERVDDAIANAKSEEELHNAIDNAPKGGELSPAARALACERLRKLGRIPPACRSEGGDGSEARP